MHKIKNQSVAYTIHERIDYAINSAKTLGGELVMAYADFTGKEISQKDVLLYQIRQSFKPGEITPE